MTRRGDIGAPSGASVPTRLGDLAVRDVGSGPPALLWHSLFVDSTTWQRVQPSLATERRLVVVDGPGHGRSRGPGRDYTLDDCAGAALDVLDRLGIEQPVDWLGNAWGGHVGIPFAGLYPHRCRSLVTVCAPVQALEPELRRQITASRWIYRALGPVGPLTRALRSGLLGPERDVADDRVVVEALRRADRSGMARAMRCASLDRPDLADRLAAVAAPTLLITAADDPYWRPEQARAAADRLPDGAVVTVPGAGHVAPLLRSPAALADTVAGFWRDPAGLVAAERAHSGS